MRENPHHALSRPRRAGRPRQAGASPAPPRAASGTASGAAEVAELAGLLEPLVRTVGMDLESVRVSAAGRRRLLRVVVDADGGVGLDEIAKVSRELSARLDAAGTMGDSPYTLEVSSPGVDRPLTEPRHWRRARGRLVAVSLAPPEPAVSSPKTSGARPAPAVSGRVVGADDQGITLEIGGQRREFAYSELGPGRVQVEFARPGDGSPSDGRPVTASPGNGGSADGH